MTDRRTDPGGAREEHAQDSSQRDVGMQYRALLAFGFALFLLGIFVYAVGWDEVTAAIYRTTLSVYLWAFAATVGTLACRTLVWHRILSIVDRPRPYWLVAGIFLTATFTKYAVPYGQVASGVGVAAVVSRYYDAAYEQGLAGVVSADFLNYLPYYTFGAVGAGYVLVVHSPSLETLGPYALPIAALVAAIAVVLGLLWSRRSLVAEGLAGAAGRIRGLIRRTTGREVGFLRRENVRRRFEGFYTTLDLVATDRRGVGAGLVFAHLGWLGLAGALYVTALAMDAPIPIGMAFLAVALSKFGFLVPTPGGVGGVELALATVLYLLAPVGLATATAIALLWRFATYWFSLSVGGVTAIAVTLTDPVPPEDG